MNPNNAHRPVFDASAVLALMQGEPGADKSRLPGGTSGPNDLMIAAIARCRGLTLVTHNTREFSRVPGLLIEDWELP